ncbi:single-stranded DNA-binding protein [Streptosporangium sp. NPDC004379]|uniref:single-stranded DNA-binding protein n=1 Tax=Streptosporangium sp. NPDC004379 TaxID=3366189 RepID=UPI0036A7B5C0
MDRNEVVLVGRLPEAASVRKLRSGSALTRWRLIVRRQPRARRVQVDTIPCASFAPEVALAAAGWLPGDMVEVRGSLRRRWWGDGGSKSSGYEVEVRSARHLGLAPGTAPTGDRGGEEAAGRGSAEPRRGGGRRHEHVKVTPWNGGRLPGGERASDGAGGSG